jgi:hypothetical protein
MIARVIVQKNAEGEKHVTLTQDLGTPTEELLLTAPGWEDSEVIEGRVLLILGMDEPDVILDELMDTELHTAWTQHKAKPRMVFPAALLAQLKTLGEAPNETV